MMTGKSCSAGESLKNCVYTRTLVAGAAFGVVYFFVSCIFWGYVFPSEVAVNASLWRPTDQMDMIVRYMLSGAFVIGLGFAYAYRKLYHGIPGEGASKGWQLGIYLWFIMGAGEGIFWYGVSNMTPPLLILLLIDKLSALLMGGHLVAVIMGKLPERC